LRVAYKVYRTVETPPATDPGRRAFLVRSASGAVALGGSGLGTYGVVWEPQHLRTRHYNPAIQNLPSSLDGLRILQISDTHYGPLMPMSFLKHVVAQANALKPDVIVLTGDYVHRTPRAIDDGIGVFEGLKSRLGTVAVLGNHDHWEGTAECVAAFERIGIPLIDNDRLFLTANGFSQEERNDAICVAGVGDMWADEVSMEKALMGVRATMPRILLSHNPDVAETMDARYRVDLMVSGHTHGGQVRLPYLGTPIVPSLYGSKYAGGLCKAPHCPVIVSRGIGLAVLPVRFRVAPEIGLITLRAATNNVVNAKRAS
jgi:predicted MPP superfamily phosphohydrolase